MKSKASGSLIRAGLFAALFLALILLLKTVDVRPIGPNGSSVGLAACNQFWFELTGVHLLWYQITDWLGVAAVLTALGFAVLGLVQLVTGRSLRKVDGSLYALGLLYLLVIAAYLFFEVNVVNCRPVLLDGRLEASFPSSHTMVVCCIMASAMLQFRERFRSRRALTACNGVAALVMAVTVIGRLLSGVHWFTDILGGLLLSGALVSLYAALCALWRKGKA